MLSLLENSTKKGHAVMRPLSEDGDLLTCPSFTNNQKEAALPLTEGSKMPSKASRRRKCGFYNSNPTVSESSLGNEEIGNKEDDEVTDGGFCLTTENYNQDLKLNSIEMHPLNDYHQSDNATKKGREHGMFDKKYLSPKPFGCDSYDVRSRSDSAIASVCSDHEKRDDQHHSVAALNVTSDSEETAVNVPVNEQLNDKSSNTLGTSSSLSSLHSVNPLQETMM